MVENFYLKHTAVKHFSGFCDRGTTATATWHCFAHSRTKRQTRQLHPSNRRLGWSRRRRRRRRRLDPVTGTLQTQWGGQMAWKLEAIIPLNVQKPHGVYARVRACKMLVNLRLCTRALARAGAHRPPTSCAAFRYARSAP